MYEVLGRSVAFPGKARCTTRAACSSEGSLALVRKIVGDLDGRQLVDFHFEKGHMVSMQRFESLQESVGSIVQHLWEAFQS
jgi:hypothetical protein